MQAPRRSKTGYSISTNNTGTFGNGTGTVTMGDTGVANNTVLSISQNGRTFTNAFVTTGTGTNSIQTNGSGQAFTFSGGFTLGGNLTLYTVNGTDTLTVSTGAIGGSGDLVTSVATVGLGGNNTAGTTYGTGGTITISSNVNHVGTITNNGTGTAATTISGSVGGNVTGITQNSATSGLTLSGNNSSFAGGVTVSSGTLKTGSTTALNAANAVTIASGAILDMNGNSQTIGGLNDVSGTGGSVINSGAAGKTLTLGGNGTYAFSGVYSGGTAAGTAGTGGLTVALTGGGSQTLSGAHLYTGATNVSAGTLAVTGTINATSGITIGGGTLNYLNDTTGLNRAVSVTGGTFKNNSTQSYTGALNFTSGTISGTNFTGINFTGGNAISTGKFISPGNSPGTLTTGAQTWQSGGTYVFEINDATGAAGTNWDLLSINGALDLSGLTSGAQFNVNLIGLTAGGVSGVVANFSNATDYSWRIATATSITGTFASDLFAVNTTGFSNNNAFGTGSFAVTNIGNDLYLSFTAGSAIPEPATYAAIFGALALAGTAACRRRQTRK